MKRELNKMSRKELEKLKVDVESALAKVADREMKEARAAAEKAAAAHGFSLDELAGAQPKKRGRKKKTAAPKTKSAAKYRNPDDANQTWTGKGRQPAWFKAAVAAGKAPESMEI